jgi:hypothetical protein
MLAIFAKVGKMRLRRKRVTMYLLTRLKIKNNLTGKPRCATQEGHQFPELRGRNCGTITSRYPFQVDGIHEISGIEVMKKRVL